MKTQEIATKLGQITVSIDGDNNGEPLVFMHGVFLDKDLWANYGSQLTGRSHVYIDMPGHGASSNVGRDWDLDECVQMLETVLDAVGIQRCILIGHSWGSMTAIRAACQSPDRFAALGLFNMPHTETKGMRRLGFRLQKWVAKAAPGFYAKQAAKSLYSRNILETRPDLARKMKERLISRPVQEISRTIDAVIINAKNATRCLNELKVPALAIVGQSDYVGIPPQITTSVVPGGHISPHEAPFETRAAIKKVVQLAG